MHRSVLTRTRGLRSRLLRDAALASCALWAVLPVQALAQNGTSAAETAVPDGQQLPVQTLETATVAPRSQVSPRTPYPEEAAGRGPRMGPNFYMIRHAEDWSFLADPKAKRDDFSSLKYIPIDKDGDAYLAFGGDQRSRYNFSSRPSLNNPKDRHEFMARTAVSADLHVGDFRVFANLQSAQIFGENENPHIGIQRNDLIVQELFAEYGFGIPGGRARLMVGRQEFFDGPRFIISPRENPNIRVSMNGVRLSADWSRFRFTAVHFTPTEQGNGAFDDDSDNGEALTGINTSFVLADKPIGGHKASIYFDPFFFHFEDDDRTLARLSGRDRRETYGARLWGRIGKASFDWVAMKQDGRFGRRPVDAWALSANQSVAIGASPTAPRLGFHADYASGGGNYATNGKVGSFNFLYNATIIFSDDNYLGAINLMGVAPTVSVPISKKVTVGAEAGFYWRPNEAEAVYRGNAQPYAGTQNVDGKQVASILRANLAWSITPHLSLVNQFNYVNAGEVLRAAGYRDNVFTSTILNFRF